MTGWTGERWLLEMACADHIQNDAGYMQNDAGCGHVHINSDSIYCSISQLITDYSPMTSKLKKTTKKQQVNTDQD